MVIINAASAAAAAQNNKMTSNTSWTSKQAGRQAGSRLEDYPICAADRGGSANAALLLSRSLSLYFIPPPQSVQKIFSYKKSRFFIILLPRSRIIKLSCVLLISFPRYQHNNNKPSGASCERSRQG